MRNNHIPDFCGHTWFVILISIWFIRLFQVKQKKFEAGCGSGTRAGLMRRCQGRASLRRFDGGLLPFGQFLAELPNGRRTNAVARHRLRLPCREPDISKSACPARERFIYWVCPAACVLTDLPVLPCCVTDQENPLKSSG